MGDVACFAMQKTIYNPKVIDEELAETLYRKLKHSIKWEEGIRSRSGFTRKAKSIDLMDFPELAEIILPTIQSLQPGVYFVAGTYINFYQTGEMYTPNHAHKGMVQFILSLGTTRTLEVGRKKYIMANGDAILFGSSIHGVPREPHIKRGRISVATFMKKLN